MYVCKYVNLKKKNVVLTGSKYTIRNFQHKSSTENNGIIKKKLILQNINIIPLFSSFVFIQSRHILNIESTKTYTL